MQRKLRHGDSLNGKETFAKDSREMKGGLKSGL
jgi:hypothetical protein